MGNVARLLSTFHKSTSEIKNSFFQTLKFFLKFEGKYLT